MQTYYYMSRGIVFIKAFEHVQLGHLSPLASQPQAFFSSMMLKKKKMDIEKTFINKTGHSLARAVSVTQQSTFRLFPNRRCPLKHSPQFIQMRQHLT